MPELPIAHVYSKIFESSVVGIGITDLTGKYVMVNPAWCEFMGYSEEEAKNLNVRDTTMPEERRQSDNSLKKIIDGELSSIRKTRRYLRKDGSCFWADLHVSALTDEQGQVIGVIGMLINIDRQVKAENYQKDLNRQLSKMARHDTLTGLYNRRAMDSIMIREHKRAHRYKRGFAIAIGDVDNFKMINDTYGHDCGDMVLKHMAETFLEWIRDTDTVGRWGGEEFLFVFSETTCEGARIVAERIRSSLDNKLFRCGDHEFHLSLTIGFSYHSEQVSVEQMIAEADKALYKGKGNGKNQVVCHQDVCGSQ
ncbi:MAG: diguanylate cyclase [Candidatus Cloacimonetes bacterium]|nr:diguanylate cyclase [Candidatus Cloacimonadota bacterium]